MLKKNLSIILILFVALVMIAIAIWFFQRRIRAIENRMKPYAVIAFNIKKVFIK